MPSIANFFLKIIKLDTYVPSHKNQTLVLMYNFTILYQFPFLKFQIMYQISLG